jgi:hypothetical protein
MILATLILGGCTARIPWTPRSGGFTGRDGNRGAASRQTASRRSTPVLARDTNVRCRPLAVAQSRARPWPRVGTPEWQQIQVEDAERERRIQDAIQNICRGC